MNGEHLCLTQNSKEVPLKKGEMLKDCIKILNMLCMLLAMYKTVSHILLPWKTTMCFAHLNTLCALEHNQLLNNLRTGH